MGYIPSSPTTLLYAYYTNLGKNYYLTGSDVDKTPVYFGLGDSDTNYVIGENNGNILTSGFVPDITGDQEDCLNGIADGIEIKNLLNYQPITNTGANEIRFFTTSNPYMGSNVLNINIDLGKYISWINTFGSYSISSTAYFNVIQPTLVSPLIQFYNSIGIYNTTTNAVDFNTNISLTFSAGDFNLYQNLNRFLLDTTKPNNFNLIQPSNLGMSSPLEFIFSSVGNQGANLIGAGGIMINNRDYLYQVTDITANTTTNYTYSQMTGVTLNTNSTYNITPIVILRYYNQGTLNSETFYLRSDNSILLNGSISNANNQYLKLFVNSSNVSLATREAQLLTSFITTRTDLFYKSNNIYYSYPLSINVSTDDPTVNNAVLRINMFYNPNATYINQPNDTFTI